MYPPRPAYPPSSNSPPGPNPYFSGASQYSQYPQYPPYQPYPPYGHDRSHSGPQFPLPNGSPGVYPMHPIQPPAAAGQGHTPPPTQGPYYPPYAQPPRYPGTPEWMAPRNVPPEDQIHSAAYRNPANFSAPPSGTATPNATEPQRQEAIFHMLCHAQYDGKANVQDPLLSEAGKKQCANLKETFPYIKDVQYVFCSPMYRSIETATLVFGSRLSEPMVSKGFPWSELRECASSDDPDKCKPVSALTDTGHTLDEIKKRAEDHPFFIAPELLQVGWETKNKTDDPKRRADEVRLELSHFSEVALTGGVWKGIRIDRPKGNGPVHIVVISHNNFLNRLTHRSELPGIDTPEVCFNPVQYRSYHFPPAAADGFEGFSKQTLYEMKESKERKHIPGAMSQKAFDEQERKREETRQRQRQAEEARKQEAAYRPVQSDSSGDCCIIL